MDRKPEGSAESRRCSIDQVVGTGYLDRKRPANNDRAEAKTSLFDKNQSVRDRAIRGSGECRQALGHGRQTAIADIAQTLEKPMVAADEPSAAGVRSEVADEVDDAALAEVMRVVPLGAGVLAGAAVALLVIGYLAIYLLVFLPRGAVG